MFQLDDPIIVIQGVGVVIRMDDICFECDSKHLLKLSGTVHSLHVYADSRRPGDAGTMSCREDDIGGHEGRAASTDGNEEVVLPTRINLNATHNLWLDDAVAWLEDILVVLVPLGWMDTLDIELIQ